MFAATCAWPPASTARVKANQQVCVLVVFLSLWTVALTAQTQRQMEFLGRGLVAIRTGEGKVFLSWRLLGTEPDGISFNVYRQSGGGAAVKLNHPALTNATCFTDEGVKLEQPVSYFVRAVVSGTELEESASFQFTTNAPMKPYLSIPLKLPPGYSANDGSVGDLDGDGEYEIVLKCERSPRDTASTGLTGETILQGLKLDGTLLWTINLGKNIREGAHYTQFMVYDLDGDGLAEIACKTADGTMDGKGKVIGDAGADWRDTNRFSRTFGRVLRGPEFFTIFDGRTGAALATTNYLPARGDLGGWGGVGGNGGNDRIGNRVDRFLACVAYLDGARPSVVMCRGYYGRSVLAAWDWRDGKLTSRWVFDSKDKDNPYSGQGAHSVSVADVDADGRDEIVYHSMVVNSDGTGRFSTGLRHGDALHVSDFDPARPGLEVFGIHENEEKLFGTPGAACYDAKTGNVLWSFGPDADIGRGLAADIDPRHPGSEMWGGASGLRTAQGERIGNAPRSANFAIWWDGDLLREILDRNRISKWNWTKATLDPLFTADGATSNNGSKATPVLSGDLLGDWREEVIFRTPDNKELRLYTTTISTTNRLVTLMHDPQYRLAIAWQNVGYNQPPHPGFHLGDGMKTPPKPNIRVTPRRPAAVK